MGLNFMLHTFKAVLTGNRLEWLDETPEMSDRLPGRTWEREKDVDYIDIIEEARIK
ncbi:MAG: hypothetical protein EBE86_007550 [Hormoscilla sp. GUM202]|nr:hypothetical protein [Hormoscilla sp. GUM202]